ncbi:SPFH domain-containing protein [Lentibacter algarum]|uniref:SPFH domain-containing protein n=1 Tax=Lentibacter algarum TaxID=576131 RepID=UPI001C0723B4|nr:SPFH domain-containing protein [Lentibacter algarum]MBU2980803.1 SPFH domain-containing protein [Lentibacter algarum]
MGIFDFLTGEFIDVIHWVDDSRDTMVWRFEREDHEIKYGAKLTVREGQAAVFIHEGQMADVFTPGLYMLETNNMPVLTTLNHWDHGFESPFKSEVYFVNTTRFNDLKWGTKNPIIARDPEFGPVRLRAYGSYTVKVSDPAKFLVEIVGTDGEFTMDEISYQIRNIIVQEFSRTIARSGIPVLDMAANTRELGTIVGRDIAPRLAEYGLEMPELYIENISLPEAVEAVLDKRTSMGVVGDLSTYMNFQAAESLTHEGAGGAALQAGVGAGLGMQIARESAQSGSLGASTSKTPPPPPVEKVWHIAENGESKGPYSRAAMGRMVADGALTRETLVWTAGQNGWLAAAQVTELAQLFTILPPPLPTNS